VSQMWWSIIYAILADTITSGGGRKPDQNDRITLPLKATTRYGETDNPFSVSGGDTMTPPEESVIGGNIVLPPIEDGRCA
jgi:hypothetical protein